MKPCLMSFNQRMLPVGGRITVRLVSSLTRLGFTKKRKYLCLCSESVETKPVKLETSHKVILPPTGSVLCFHSCSDDFIFLLNYRYISCSLRLNTKV